MAKKPLDFTSFSSDEIINGCRQFENLYDANIEAPGEYLERKRSRDMQTLIRYIVDNELEGIRKIIFMRVFFEEEKIQDVASSLEICQSNAYKHYEKALKKMRESLKYVVVYLNCCRNDEMTPLESMQKYAFASRKNTSLPAISMRLYRLMEKENVDKKKLCNCIGIDEEHFSKALCGEVQLTACEISLLSGFFRVTTDYILKGDLQWIKH